MNKRMKSILICFVMMVTMFMTTIQALAAESTPFYILPDKTKADPGEVITYTVQMGKITGMAGLALEMDIPDGLEYVSGSGKEAESIQNTLHAVIAEYTDITHIFAVGMSDYTGDSVIDLFSFQCRVKNNATGTLNVGFADIEVIDGEENDIPYDISDLKSSITVNCAHTNKTKHDAGISTCKNQANAVYYTCNECSQKFLEDQTTKTNTIPLLPLADHTPAQVEGAQYLASEGDCQTSKKMVNTSTSVR